MKMTQFQRAALLMAAAGSLVGVASQAAVVDTYFAMSVFTSAAPGAANTAYELGRLNDGVYLGDVNEEYGAQVTLNSGAGSVLRGISFYYYSDYSKLGGLTYTIWSNDGSLVAGQPSPGTVLFNGSADIQGVSSGSISQTVVPFPYDPSKVLPPTITISLFFDGQDASHHAGWLTSDAAPAVGSHAVNQFWNTLDGATTWNYIKMAEVPEANGAQAVGIALGLFGMFRFCKRGLKAAV
jgi:hypothetical protein